MDDNSKSKSEKSYLSSAVDSLNPWANSSRSVTPTPNTPTTSTTIGDHSTTHLYGQSIKSYPSDCPPLRVQWFHATDTPKRKPVTHISKPVDEKPLPQPKKFAPFSQSDSRSIEHSYQTLLERSEQSRAEPGSTNQTHRDSPRNLVPVKEDYLYDVDIRNREVAPVFWAGPVFEVLRGTWFYQEGSTLRPCDENLASQLEEGFLKVKPWTYPKVNGAGHSNDTSPKPSVSGISDTLTPSAEHSGRARQARDQGISSSAPSLAEPRQPESHRLFGAYMNSVATYHDDATAWLSSDSVLSWVTSTVYQRFSGGSYMSGIKLVRGWTALPSRGTENKAAEDPTSVQSTIQPRHQQDEGPPQVVGAAGQLGQDNLGVGPGLPDPPGNGPQNDIHTEDGDDQGRDIEHLILATHGIGQLLGARMESMNFVRDVDVLRKTMKATYANSVDLCALNRENGDGRRNCRVQVLPVCWRHLLEFPKRREKRGERDIGDVANEDDEYPSLEDITVEGMAFARSLISDLALDVLLYQSAYRQSIAAIVLKEANRIFKLFKERNPGFTGKVHVIGHSLGSAVMFDILCRQRETTPSEELQRDPLGFWPAQSGDDASNKKALGELQFEFDVDDFYCLGSPVGLFQMLKGRTIAGRHARSLPSESPLEADPGEDPFETAPPSRGQNVSTVTGMPFSVSSPKVAQLFNIFHPSDPISYRLEPLISSSLSKLKPQSLPYTKKNIFSNVAQQGFTGIGAKVGQSMSGLWTSLSAGITGNLLIRNLGLTSDDIARLSNTPGPGAEEGEGALDADGTVVPGASQLGERTNERKKELASTSIDEGRRSTSGNDVTLIDDELETLLSRLHNGDSKLPGNRGEPEEVRRAQREDGKIRALNRNGRVDYSIQEGVLDFNPINTIASHMSYWADEDVSHFILSQLLSNRRRRTEDAESSAQRRT
ncbi:DDHD domain-containing protein [Plectosphaerella plurivora]|uniref:DDHD domain-containing protein n=1 Tax=Plectosphaerella plurivora TaxID=936078 RepID=A0A9P8V211_9PEZI|nr:DDHD domain-containing protein [Plectosphaerella plurivora]